MKTPKALTIAGSDSSGGAGIQADLKTFAALKVYGMSVITAITAQNTIGVTEVHEVPPKIVKAQIEAVMEDIGVDAVKTGMLYSKDIIEVVAEEVEKYNFKMVIDPVMIAKSGAPLLKKDSIEALIKKLIPLATVVTPNAKEAEVLLNKNVESLDEAREAAKQINALGAEAVVIKGGHLKTEDVVYDVLYYKGEFKIFKSERIQTKNTHGTGCVFASAITAFLAKNKNIEEAVERAKEFVLNAIQFSYSIGKGVGPVNPMAYIYREAEKYEVLKLIENAVEMLESNPEVALLIPESQSNIGMALSYSKSIMDVAAIPGRIVKLNGKVKASAYPRFGASKHIANTIITVMKKDPEFRSAMNIKYSKKLIELCKNLGLKISFYDRSEEPPEIKEKEGLTTIWGTQEAIKKVEGIPDVIYHGGDYGKEPMIIILGRNPIEVAQKVIQLAKQIVRL
ncbi:MAG: bifunctional hydroxymethylpyrimidine kinase/phosphomethylpyrimidine kinase [Candidatus Bathyarchaeia archaeon]|nr:bifunctional hydroxymethylpyrimidine kinase/phosphomethylpyrimidine kinase [Candidatus Bathyarchaeota archaeon]